MSSEHVSIDEESRGCISKITASLKKISIIIILLQHYLRYSYVDNGNLLQTNVQGEVNRSFSVKLIEYCFYIIP